MRILKALFVPILVGLISLGVPSSLAQQHQRMMQGAEDPYDTLTDEYGDSCCSGKDCRPALYKFAEGAHQLSLNGGATWFKVKEQNKRPATPKMKKMLRRLTTWCGSVYQNQINLRLEYRTICWVREDDVS